MDAKTFFRKYGDWIFPGICLGLLFLFLGLKFDFYYDLNDDVLLRDILSGVYTGQPEARNAQMLYPLSWLLALLYRCFSGAPVLGVFLWLCQAGSLYVIWQRSMRYASSLPGKMILCLTETAAACCMLLYHLVFVQYTVTAGLMMAAAIFWFFTSKGPSGQKTGKFFRQNLPAVLLAVTAFFLRPEMMLLLLPLAAVAGIWKWAQEAPVFTRKNGCAFAGLFGLILAGMLAGKLLDTMACAGEEWQEFGRLFDARTEVYDFKSGSLREYEENREFYDAAQITPLQCELLQNYNYGADDDIDAALMERVADYGIEKEGYFVHSLDEGLWLYRERLKNNTSIGLQEMPWLLFEAALLVFLLLAALRRRRGGILWRLLLFGGVRSILWMYLILRERVPERISHPLYWTEIILLFALLLELVCGEKRQAGSLSVGRIFTVRSAVLILLLAVSLCWLPREAERTITEYESREERNAADQAARAYYRERTENLYLADVGSTVAFSEKLFAEETSLGNYDLLGGWLCKSPLAAKKLSAFGFSTMGEAVKAPEGVFFVGEEGTDWSWLEELLSRDGEKVRLVQKEQLGTGESALYVWQAEKEQTEGR